MFLEKSKFGSSTRVRIVEKQFEGGKWKKKLICHIDTAKSDIDLEFLTSKAKETLDELKNKDQWDFHFPLGISYKVVLDEIISAKAAIVGLREQKFIIPPSYSPLMQQI